MQALVVVEVDVAADCLSKRVVGVEGATVVHVRLHRLVPGLHVRVVVHAPRAELLGLMCSAIRDTIIGINSYVFKTLKLKDDRVSIRL